MKQYRQLPELEALSHPREASWLEITKLPATLNKSHFKKSVLMSSNIQISTDK
jgi:hypothetical protein